MKKLLLIAGIVASLTACVPLQVRTDTQIGRHTNVRIITEPVYVPVHHPRPRLNPYVYPYRRYDIYGHPYSYYVR